MMHDRQKAVIRILLFVAKLLAADVETKKEIETLATHIVYSVKFDG